MNIFTSNVIDAKPLTEDQRNRLNSSKKAAEESWRKHQELEDAIIAESGMASEVIGIYSRICGEYILKTDSKL